MPKPLIIAIDGPSGVGKSTLGRALAARLGCPFVESGAMYRAVALKAVECGLALEDAAGLAELTEKADIRFLETARGTRISLDGRDVTEAIRAPAVTEAASVVSTYPRVREILVSRQRAFGQSGRGVVMEGRDIGTVVFPGADLKIYLDAAAPVRGERRLGDVAAADRASPQEVLEQMEARDRRDQTRQASPLVAAGDAVRIDSTGLTAEEVAAQVFRLVDDQLKSNSPSSSPNC